MINKDTLLFGSFSKTPGNTGCFIFNKCFLHCNINAIYKSFFIDNLNDAIISAKCLKFSGFALSMPYKTEIIPYLDSVDEIVKKTNSCNTVVIKNGKLMGYNTDYYAIYDFLSDYAETDKILYILGNGAYSNNVKICCEELKISYNIIKRNTWDQIKIIENSIIFNCTPVENISYMPSNIFIDCCVNSKTGKLLALKQAKLQFEIYNELKFPNIINIGDL